ncbi:hypothetical protein OCU04_003276 [Sclerotinia nivalis]|uniref:6-phosphogluconate dehydrogenase C-terminal domain-containing protein n=1 Tax=Sclerotinia nivalis TaxID=352851 RepID=A0A9X0DLP7_9HELO|nr:hypothetical protein OCU04_003276 [Sclerotinia nivalis]
MEHKFHQHRPNLARRLHNPKSTNLHPPLSNLLSPSHSTSSTPDPLSAPSIISALTTGFAPLKRTTSLSVHYNAITPSMSATLEYLKYTGNMELPTQFYEAELNYFGRHMFESKRFDEK